MSIKTLRKRIALVAVSALGVGLLSVAPASAAGETAASTLYVASAASATGAADTASLVEANMKSVGWISKTSTNGTAVGATGFTLTGGLAGTAVVFSGAKIAFGSGSAATASSHLGVVVTGGTLSGITNVDAGADAPTVELNGSATTAVHHSDTDNSTEFFGGVFNVSAAAGSTATISLFGGTGITGLSTATNGALLATWTFTVASASASGVYSASQSTVTTQAAVTKGTVAAGTNAFDNTDRIANGSVGIIYMELDDAYAANITSGAVSASATNGATVKIANAAADTGAEAYAATASFDTLATATAEMYVYVNQPVANTAGSTTVTLTLDGATVGTKTLNWNGDIASITVLGSSKTTFANGVTQADCTAGAPSLAGSAANIVYVVKDAAGNAVTLSASPTVTGATGALVGATVTSGTSATAANGCVRQTSALGYGVQTMLVPATSLQGAGTYKLRVQNSAGVNIDSAEQKATVSNGSTDKFTASWDKATYAPGELATLTIKIQDAYGNLMAAGTPLTGLALAVASGFTAVGTACANTSLVDSAGVVTCQYAAGNTEGAYSFSIDLDTGTTQAATVGALNVKNTTAAVSNAEVLAAIVKLIASINKQIRALQKSLRR